jgi:general secretion pathway protein A
MNLFAQALAQTGRQVALVTMLGIDRGQFVHQLGTQFETNLPATAAPATQWRAIVDRILANRYQRRDTVLLLDDADEADREVLAQVARLAECDDSPQSRLTMVLAAHSGRLQQLGDRLLGLSELRIEIEPWDVEEVRGFLQHALKCADVADNMFDSSAVVRLHELTRGVPRRVSQLAELALIAGAGAETEEINGDTVEAVFEELAVQSTFPAAPVYQ